MQKECQKKEKKKKKRKCSEVMKEEEWKWERKSGEAKGEGRSARTVQGCMDWYGLVLAVRGKGRGQRYKTKPF